MQELPLGYVIDTNSLIDLYRRHYSRDRFPTLWEKFEALISQGLVISSLQVFKEIEQKDDELLKWTKANKGMFKDLDTTQEKYMRRIMSEPIPGFNLGLVNIRKLKSAADPFVIALAKSKGWTVITSEKPVTPNPTARPSIPNVCKYYDLKCIPLHPNFFEEQDWRF